MNWNIDLNSLGTLFKKKRRASSSDALIVSTRKIWRFSIMFLGVFAALVLACDAYIFWEYVYNQQDVDIGDQGNVKGINRTLFDSVAKTIDERAANFERAKTAGSIRNPFSK